MNNKINKLSQEITKEQIEKLYLEDNLKKDEVAKTLNITMWSLSNLLKLYDIKKDKQLSLDLAKVTNIKRYGVDNPSKNKEVINKIIQTNQKRYNANSFTATEKGKLKVFNTKKEHFNDGNYNNSEQGKLTKKIKYNNCNYNNMMSTYGVSNSFQLLKTKESILEHLIKNKQYNPIFKNLINNRDNSIDFLKDKNYSYFDLVKLLNAPYYTICMWIKRLDLKDYISFNFIGKSHYEDEIIDFIKNLKVTNISRNNKDILDGLELDIYLPDYNIGIEFDGTYWHSDLFKDKDYHFKKSLLAQEKGMKLIHIYQYEWDNINQREKIKSFLRIALGKVQERIYARNCSVRLITNKEAKELNNEVHLQGHRDAHLTYGLFYKDKLVQLMSFSHHKKYEWEIIRDCPGSNNIVIGGVSKLFNYFIKENNPSEIFSYCDFNKFDGKSYEILGMNFIGYTGPDMKYVIGDTVVNRQPSKYKEIKQYIDYRIYGSGSKKYLWIRNR